MAMLCNLTNTASYFKRKRFQIRPEDTFNIPVDALYIRAILSMLPVMKNDPSGDHARSYISAIMAPHIFLTLHVSNSSDLSSPKADVCELLSAWVQRITFPSSPALARTSPVKIVSIMKSRMHRRCRPLGDHRTTFTVCWCLARVDR